MAEVEAASGSTADAFFPSGMTSAQGEWGEWGDDAFRQHGLRNPPATARAVNAVAVQRERKSALKPMMCRSRGWAETEALPSAVLARLDPAAARLPERFAIP